jgi:hypothetical protein
VGPNELKTPNTSHPTPTLTKESVTATYVSMIRSTLGRLALKEPQILHVTTVFTAANLQQVQVLSRTKRKQHTHTHLYVERSLRKARVCERVLPNIGRVEFAEIATCAEPIGDDATRVAASSGG